MSLSSMIISRDWQEVSVLECILSGMQIDVDVESELDRAWIRLKKSKVDAIIVDCDADGVRNFMRKLRTSLPGSTPVVIASGSPSNNGLRGTGATFVVEKPVSVENAVHTLSAARNLIMNERLRYYREALDLSASVTRDSGKRVKANVVNISKGGIKIECSQPLTFSETVKIGFSLPEMRSPIQAEGKVAWADSHGGAGIRFMQIESRLAKRLELWVEQRYFHVHEPS
jgi:DNA-binding response OmpR family regulator